MAHHRRHHPHAAATAAVSAGFGVGTSYDITAGGTSGYMAGTDLISTAQFGDSGMISGAGTSDGSSGGTSAGSPA